MNRNAYEERLDAVREQIALLSSCFLIWENLCDVTEEQLTAMNQLLNFFSPIRNSSLEHGRLILVAIFSKNSKTVNIPSLLEAAEQSSQELAPYLSSQDFSQIRTMLGQIRPAINKMRPARHKTAHLDLTISPEPYKVGERRKVVKMAQDVYSLLYYGFKGIPASFDLVNNGTKADTKRVLDLLVLPSQNSTYV